MLVGQSEATASRRAVPETDWPWVLVVQAAAGPELQKLLRHSLSYTRPQ